MTGFILVVAVLMLVLYLRQHAPSRSRDRVSYGFAGAASGSATNDDSVTGGEFGGAEASFGRILRRRVMPGLSMLLLLLVPCVPAANADDTLPVVDHVALDRYIGRWYEVARLPNRFERACAGDVTATYTSLPQGQLAVVNQCRKADGTLMAARGVARPAGKTPSARLEVRFAPAWLGFLPIVWGDYWIIALADDYSWSLVGSPDREYLWILSRQPSMAREQTDALLARAHRLGFDTSRIIHVENRAQ